MTVAKQVAATNLSLPADTYIYQLANLDSVYVAISSDDSLTYFDPTSLALTHQAKGAHQGLTCISKDLHGSRTVVTAGRDGLVKCWDERCKGLPVQMREPRGAGLTALAVRGDYITAGTESTKEGLGDVNVLVWDTRKRSEPIRNYAESHTDTITQLAFGSLRADGPNTLMSAATDGLVSIFDTNISEEDDALLQVFNHHSAVHCAGFISDLKDEVYAVSSDEQFSIYTLDQPGYPEDHNPPVYEFGDVREKLECAYIVGMFPSSGVLPAWIAAGNTSNQTLRLTQLNPRWSFNHDASISLTGAHGDEIVRDFLLDTKNTRIVTCGEDGHVRVWDAAEDSNNAMDTSSPDSSKTRRKKKSKGKEDNARFNPY